MVRLPASSSIRPRCRHSRPRPAPRGYEGDRLVRMAQPFHSSLAVPVAGGSLHVGVAGPPPGTPGVPVVLAVHGITGSHRSWAPVARHLGDDVIVLAPDLRGRGESAGHRGPHGMAAHVEDLLAVLDHVGCSRAVLAGHSMGGYIVVRFA